MRVYISSGTHVGNVADRVGEIKKQLESPEVVFGEGGGASQRGQARALVLLFPRAPLIALAAALQVFVFLPLGGWVWSALTGGSKGRDLDIMQQIASEYDAEISEIDPVPTAQPVHDRPLLWSVVNWLPAVGLPVLLVPSNPLQFAVAHSLLRFVLIGYVLLFVVLYLVNERREDAMAAMIRKRASDVDTACVVLGEAHHAGVGKRLADTEGIDVLNPTPVDMGLLARFILYIWKLADRLRR